MFVEISDGWNHKFLAKPWDGITPGGQIYPYKDRELMMDENGTIWYRQYGKSEYSVWCSAERLEAHIHHLNQVLSRR